MVQIDQPHTRKGQDSGVKIEKIIPVHKGDPSTYQIDYKKYQSAVSWALLEKCSVEIRFNNFYV